MVNRAAGYVIYFFLMIQFFFWVLLSNLRCVGFCFKAVLGLKVNVGNG